MFTGIIQHIGKVLSVKSTVNGKTFSISVDNSQFSGFDTVKIGDSIAINGLCTTVVSLAERSFSVNLMNESLKHSCLGDFKGGEPVNLELAMGVADRFGGHIVSGHIDTVGTIQKITEDGFSRIFAIECDTHYVVQKGSITLNGVSLTVSSLENGLVEVSLIPHTLQNTIFKHLKAGDKINVEYDILAKYIEKFTVLDHNKVEKTSKIDEKFLIENGF